MKEIKLDSIFFPFRRIVKSCIRGSKLIDFYPIEQFTGSNIIIGKQINAFGYSFAFFY